MFGGTVKALSCLQRLYFIISFPLFETIIIVINNETLITAIRLTIQKKNQYHVSIFRPKLINHRENQAAVMMLNTLKEVM